MCSCLINDRPVEVQSILQALSGRPGVAKVSQQEGLRLQQALRSIAVANGEMGRIAIANKEAGFQESDEQALLDAVADVASKRVSSLGERAAYFEPRLA